MTLEASNRCRFNESYDCIGMKETCANRSLIDCLKVRCMVQEQTIAELKKRKMLKHNTASLHWRDKAFYYKKANRKLRLLLKEVKSDTQVH